MTPFRVLLIDDPVPYRNRHLVRHDGKKSRYGIGVFQRYSAGVMTEQDLISLGEPMLAVCAPDVVVFAWATCPNLDMHFRIMEARGFVYSTTAFVWCKTYPKSGGFFYGPGRHVPANAELCLQWRLPGGKPWWPNTGWKPNQIVAAPHPRGADKKIIHSRKPPDVHERIEKWLSPYIGDHRMLEIFATEPRPGWTAIGHAVTGRDIREDLAMIRSHQHGQLSLLEVAE